MSIWKQLFGESQKDAWTRLAAEIGGQFNDGSWGLARSVSARLGGYDIVLDTFTVSTGKSSATYTRLRAPFANARGLRFNLHRASIFTGLAKALGKQDIEIGVADFDKDFVIQANDEQRARELLGDPALRAMIQAHPRVTIGIEDTDGSLFGGAYGPLVDALSFVEGGVIRDVPRLASLFSLFAVLLKAFQRGGHPLDVPPAEVQRVFADLLDDVVGALGGSLERVGDTLAMRLDDPLGVTGEARLIVAIPSMPAMTTSIAFDGALPPGPSISVKARSMFGGANTGDAAIDEHVAVAGEPSHTQRLLRPLGRLARYRPVVEATNDAVKLDVQNMIAHDAFIAVGAVLDLWQELVRARAGL